jgi:hypothetical protein
MGTRKRQRWKPGLTLILTASALFLNGASVEKQSPSENPSLSGPAEQKNDTKADKSEADKENPQRNWNWNALLWGTQLPNLVTGVGWIIAAIIAALTLKALNKQIVANIEAANAAKDANKLAREVLEISRRARLSIKNVQFIEEWPALPIVRFTVTNSGEMPATGVLKYPLRTQNDPALEEHEHIPNKVGSGDIIDPHTERSDDFDLVTHSIGNRAVFNGLEEWQIFIRGEFNPPAQIGICVAYWDGFNKNRLTESWHRYNLLTKQWERTYLHQG